MLSPFASFYLKFLTSDKKMFWEVTVKRRSLAVFSTVDVTVWLLWSIDVHGKVSVRLHGIYFKVPLV